MPTTEITAHAASQFFGLSDVKNAIVTVAHQVATGLGREVAQERFQPLAVFNQRFFSGWRPQLANGPDVLRQCRESTP